MSEEQTKYCDMSEAEKKKEDWMNSKWRPAMGWLYMLVCLCDFIVFPVLWGLMHAILHTTGAQQWQPLTLQGAGLFHLAMGAVLGLAAWGRTQEKMNGANNGGLPMPGMGGGFGSGMQSPGMGAPGMPPRPPMPGPGMPPQVPGAVPSVGVPTVRPPIPGAGIPRPMPPGMDD